MLTSEAGTMVMDARLGDEYAWHVARREDASHARVTMSRVTALRVRVVDAAGAPLGGIPVVLRGARCEPIWSATCDAAGFAELRFADAVVRAARARHTDLTLSVDVPGGDAHVLPRGEIPIEPVELRAAPGRSVVVLVRDASGAPCARPTLVRLAPAGLALDCGAARVRETSDGRAVFASVPGGLDLVARVETRCSPTPIEVAVRTRADADLEVVAAAREPMPRVAGRLVDPRAGAWREYVLRAYASQGDGFRLLDEARTDGDGRFEIDVPSLSGATRPVEVVLVARNAYGRAAASAPIALAPEAGARRDLGDVAATDWTALARGLVVDENEVPLPGAAVELCDASGAPDPRTRVVADERGGFVLRGPAPAGDEVRVRAVEPEGRSAEALVTLRRGETRARIVIAVHGRLQGSVILPMGAPDGAVLVRVEQPSGAVLSLSVETGGVFAFSNVEPGELRVSFAPLGFDEPLLWLDRVLVPRGGPSSDPRLVHVDLTQLASVLELEVVDERGQPIESGWAGAVMDEPGRPRGRPYEMVDGVARIVVPRGRPVQVSAHGYQPVVLEAPAGRVRVEMRPEGG